MIFIYFLHRISRRIPIPFQQRDKDSNNIEHALQITSFHPNKFLNCFYILIYRLTAPQFPSYYFDDLPPDQTREIIESHLNLEHSHQRMLSITAQKMTSSLFKKRSLLQYASLSLRLWSVASGIVALALCASFWMNVLLEYCIASIFNHGNIAQMLGLCALFPIIHVSMWWIKRQWQSLKLLWFNTADHHSANIAIVWRLFNFFFCLIFTLCSAVSSGANLNVSDSIFWQLFLRWMVVQGLLWEIGYAILCFLVNIWVVYRLYLKNYKFAFLQKIAKSQLQSIRKSMNQLSNYAFSSSANDEHKEEKQESSDDVMRLNELQQIEEDIEASMRDRNDHSQNGCQRILEFFCALKENEDRESMICCNRIRAIYTKFFWIFLVLLAIIICLAVSVSADNEASFCLFAAICLILYYLIVLFRRAKYNALYYFWSSRYHRRFYAKLQIVDSLKNSSGDSEYIAMHQIESEQCVVYKDVNRGIFVKTQDCEYLDFWSILEYDDNDFYGCSVFCSASKEVCALFCAFFVIAIFIGLAITFSASSYDPATTSVDATTTAAEGAADNVIAAYPMCQLRAGSEYLTLLDMVYLTVTAYYSDATELRNLFVLWFGSDSDWRIDSMHIEVEKPAFYHIANSEMDLIAIRGTYDMDDVLQDISLYTEVFSLQLFSWIIPLTTVLSIGFVRDFVRIASFPEGIMDPRLRNRYDEKFV